MDQKLIFRAWKIFSSRIVVDQKISPLIRCETVGSYGTTHVLHLYHEQPNTDKYFIPVVDTCQYLQPSFGW